MKYGFLKHMPLGGGFIISSLVELRIVTVVTFLVMVINAEDIFADNLIPGDSSFETGMGDVIAEPSGEVVWDLDSNDAYDGKQSSVLKFDSKGSVKSKTIVIPPELDGKIFTFSFYAKAEKTNIRGTCSIVMQDPLKVACFSSFTLTSDWKRYSISGKLSKGKYWLAFGVMTSAIVRVDGFQLEAEERPSKYENNVRATVGISIPMHNGFVFFKGEKIPVKISVLNISEASKEYDVQIRISDYKKSLKAELMQTVTLENNRFSMKHEFIPEELGWYSIQVKLIDKGKIISEDMASVVVVLTPVKIDSKNMPFCGVYGGYRGYGLDRIGADHWIEVFTHWSTLESSKDKYRWPDISWVHNEGRKCKLNIGIPWVPKWAWSPEDIKDCADRQLKEPRFGFLPSAEHMESWKKFMHDFAEQYKEQADIIEVGAETDLVFGTNSYYQSRYPENVSNGLLVGGPAYDRFSEMIRIACEEIRKVAPKVKIGIIRPSSVDCTDKKPQYSFSTQAIRENKNYFDYFPLDCYGDPRYIGRECPGEAALPEDYLIDDLTKALKICKNEANGQHIYVSEIGYGLDYRETPDSPYSMEMLKRLPRMYLLARMTPGCESLHWFTVFGRLERGKYNYGLWRAGMPLPTVPAYAAVAQIVENVKESKELFLGGNSKIVVFRKSGRADAGIWFVRGKGKLISSESPDGIAFSDVMGNPINSKNVIEIDEYPVYLKMEGQDAFEKLVNFISKSQMICEPLDVSFWMPRCDKGLLSLRNLTNTDINARIKLMADQSLLAEQTIKIEKNKKISLSIPLKKIPTKVNVAVDCGESHEKIQSEYLVDYGHCPRIDFAGRIDGNLIEWEGRPYIAMNDRSQIVPHDPWIDYRGPEQFSAKVYLGWDSKYFYMAADIKDEIHFNKFPEVIRKGDSIQFAFHPIKNTMPKEKSGYGEIDKELGIALVDNKPTVSQWAGKGSAWENAEYAVVRDETSKRTFYEMRIPFKSLGISSEAGTILGFNFVIPNDDTGAGANYWYRFAPGILDSKNPMAFKKFMLSE